MIREGRRLAVKLGKSPQVVADGREKEFLSKVSFQRSHRLGFISEKLSLSLCYSSSSCCRYFPYWKLSKMVLFLLCEE